MVHYRKMRRATDWVLAIWNILYAIKNAIIPGIFYFFPGEFSSLWLQRAVAGLVITVCVGVVVANIGALRGVTYLRYQVPRVMAIFAALLMWNSIALMYSVSLVGNGFSGLPTRVWVDFIEGPAWVMLAVINFHHFRRGDSAWENPARTKT